MDKCYADIIRNIAINLEFKEVLNFTLSNKHIYNSLDNLFFKHLAIKYYTRDFWVKAKKRPINFSRPLENMKLELIRIDNFQNHLEHYNFRRWNLDDFYKYWNLQISIVERPIVKRERNN